MKRRFIALGVVALLAGGTSTLAVDEENGPPRTLYVVATAHLDTQWRWTIRDTIEKFVPATLRSNFALFEKYPDYTFSFEGAFRYMLAKEYYPVEYARLKRFVEQGRWRVAGSWVDAVDTNIPSPESLFRQALYGNGFFRREFARESRDVFLPDCFGFGFALPAIAAHSGLVGFSSQKLSWGSSVGVPFDVGFWEGVDGSRLLAALNPGDYAASIYGDLSSEAKVVEALDRTGKASGLYVGMRYFGIGDVGGAPDAGSVERLEKAIESRGPVTVRSVASDQLARDLVGADAVKLGELPRYRGELLMTSHGAGCYTSQAAMKRFNRKNERRADAAERAAVAADWLGGASYPREALREAWVRFLWHQFHDDLTGTSIPEAYEISWNDETIAANQFAGVLSDSVGVVARAMDTGVRGVPLVVYNPLSIPREDIVEADVVFHGPAPGAVRVYATDGREVPAQVARADGSSAHVVFLAAVPSVGFAVYDVRPAATAGAAATGLSAREGVLENPRYRVEVGASGDIVSIRDKRENRELLTGPIQLQLLRDEPSRWPAWEVEFADLSASPSAVVGGPARIRVVESGPARAALEVVRETEGSSFVQTIRLAAGSAGDRVEVENEIDWRGARTLLKVAFPLTTANQTATYDLGLGTVQRPINAPKLYEVPAQQWAELTAADGRYGVAILNDCKYGWDHPDAGTLRLTLLHTPGIRDTRWRWVGEQASQDIGHHRFVYALSGHPGDWREGDVTWQADRLNQPLLAWQAAKHRGPLGRAFSLLQVQGPGGGSLPQVAVRALKKAEESDELVVRLEELSGRPVDAIRLTMNRPIVAVREINAAEEPLPASDPRVQAPAKLDGGALLVPFAPYQPRTFALRLAQASAHVAAASGIPLPLPYDLDGISRHATDGDFDGAGHTIAGELLPETVTVAGLTFRTGPRQQGQANVVTCRGQRLGLPPGEWNRLYLLAAAVGGDRQAAFGLGSAGVPLWVQDWAEPIGQWDDRLNGGARHDRPAEIVPAFTKPARLAWLGTHRHSGDGSNEAYTFTQLFLYRLDLPSDARSVTLPNDPAVRVLAATVAHNENDAVAAAQPLLDLPRRAAVRIRAPHTVFVDPLAVAISSPNPHAVVRYTLDGSEPGPGSPIVHGSLTLQATTTVRARAFAPGLDDRFVATATFTRLVPSPASAVPKAKAGLACRYVEGSWRELPDLAALRPVREGVVPEATVPAFARSEYFALELNGYLRVPSDGLYTLSLRSDDTAALDLDGEPVIDPDASNGGGDDRRDVALAAGLHRITVRYLHRRLAPALELWIEGPSFRMRRVRTDELAHD